MQTSIDEYTMINLTIELFGLTGRTMMIQIHF